MLLCLNHSNITKCLTPFKLWKTKGKATVAFASTLAATGAAATEEMMLALSIAIPKAGAAT
jgi:hypothetical protein